MQSCQGLLVGTENPGFYLKQHDYGKLLHEIIVLFIKMQFNFFSPGIKLE